RPSDVRASTRAVRRRIRAIHEKTLGRFPPPGRRSDRLRPRQLGHGQRARARRPDPGEFAGRNPAARGRGRRREGHRGGPHTDARTSDSGLSARDAGGGSLSGPADGGSELGRVTSAAAAPLVEASGLSRSYALGEAVVPAVRDVSLTIAAGDFVALKGPSG